MEVNNMKKCLFLLLVIILTSCIGVETPNMTKERPFIVNKIQEVDSDNNRYTHLKYYNFSEYFSAYPSIIAPKGTYNIGDTIKFCK